MSKPSGFILYDGPSLIDGAPIVAIAITSSSNRKTGNMVQTYILRRDMSPIDASRIGADESVCGHCPQRWHLGGACYVNLGQAPLGVWRAFHRGAYPRAKRFANAWFAPDPSGARSIANGTPCIGKGRMVRLGTYGDPAAVPADVWRDLVSHAIGHTGYTHQMRNASIPEAQRVAIGALCMVSVDSAQDAQDAHAHGWRSFHVQTADAARAPWQFTCPASAEAGKRKTCADCGACNGTRGADDRRASVAIVVHGSLASRFNRRAA